MADEQKVSALTSAANAGLKDPKRSFNVRAGASQKLRFELYHASISLCSQKVRAVLAEKMAPFASHDLSIISLKSPSGEVIAAENYHPAYVRLRLHGGKSLGRPLVSGYTGATSVDTEGFDPCVVPLLVDHDRGEVVVDSMRICAYIDREVSSSPQLVPASPSAAEVVMAQVAIVDKLPNGRFLYGFHPDNDQRPDALKRVMADIYNNKIMALQKYMLENADDEDLVAAYRSKIAKEAGAKPVQRNAAFQREGRAMAEEAIHDLEADLKTRNDEWVCGSDFTLADVVWGVQLFRMQYLGLAMLWADRPAVSAYVARLYRRASIREEALKASAQYLPPSEHTAHLMLHADIPA
jgi:glutathione S-transferase